MDYQRSDNRVDPNFAIHLLLDIAHEHSLEILLQKLIQKAIEHPNMLCGQTWLVKKGDRCSTCLQRVNCKNQSRCLHLVVGKTKHSSENDIETIMDDDTNLRIPWGVNMVGKVAETGRQIILNDLNIKPEYSNEFKGMDYKKIGGCCASPIMFKGEVLGVNVSIGTRNVPDQAPSWGQIFADHLGAIIANAHAFEEIQRLKAQLEQQNSYLQEEVVEAKAFGDLVGQSAALRQIISQIDLVAATDASVLILGETGTGKDLVAHEIHRRSLRKDYPMVRVNCASIPKELIESELFGHVKGAFTGAIKDRPGRFETAEGGTLFLDEIGEMALEMQSKLLRVLQEKSYERVGDDHTRHADVRIIAATNRDLKKEVAAGRFREDLYYRLHVFPIHVATLKERKEDIPILATHFVDLSVKELRCPKPRLPLAAVSQLQNYDWPGNVRELRNVIERAVILARGGVIHFNLPVKDVTSNSASPTPASKTEFLTEAEMDRHTRDNLMAVLNKANWKIKGPNGAAELLGVKPTTLLSRIKKMGLKRPVQ